MKEPKVSFHLSQFLSEVRKAQGLSQQEVADKADMVVTAYSRLEQGKGYKPLEMRAKTFKAIGGALRVHPEDLFKVACYGLEKKPERKIWDIPDDERTFLDDSLIDRYMLRKRIEPDDLFFKDRAKKRGKNKDLFFNDATKIDSKKKVVEKNPS